MKNNKRKINKALYIDKRPEFLQFKSKVEDYLEENKMLLQQISSDNPQTKRILQRLVYNYDATIKTLWNTIRMVAKMHDGVNEPSVVNGPDAVKESLDDISGYEQFEPYKGKFDAYWYGSVISTSKAELRKLFGITPNAGQYRNQYLMTTYNDDGKEIIFGLMPPTDAVEPSMEIVKYEIVTDTKENSRYVESLLNNLIQQLRD